MNPRRSGARRLTPMKTNRIALVSIAVLLLLSTPPALAAGIGTAFTYQGRLDRDGIVASGLYDFTFALFDNASGGAQQGGTLVTNGVQVADGAFTVTLDFGAVFQGASRWLAIAVRPNGTGAWTWLAPRQPLTPAPYAIYAPNAGSAALLGGQGAAAFAPAAGSPAYVAKAGDTMTGALTVDRTVTAGGLALQGDAALNDHVLHLRSAADANHGLGWCGPGHPFAARTDIDGPVIYGWNSGALGTTVSGEKVVLQWNQWGWVGITGGLQTPDVQVSGTTRTGVLQITGGADIAEPFAVSGESIPQGAVVVIDEDNPGRLRLSAQAYDTRVAGVVSGANGIRPGLTLSQQGAIEGGHNVALSGRVYVQADASNACIKPGDLLTTSDVPGHAMKALDPARAQGAILGKAMSELKEGRGMVLVLVSLQ